MHIAVSTIQTRVRFACAVFKLQTIAHHLFVLLHTKQPLDVFCSLGFDADKANIQCVMKSSAVWCGALKENNHYRALRKTTIYSAAKQPLKLHMRWCTCGFPTRMQRVRGATCNQLLIESMEPDNISK